MLRTALALTWLSLVASPTAADADPVREKLAAAKTAYDDAMNELHKQILEWFDKRGDAARNTGDKRAVDLLKADRAAYEESGELPRDLSALIQPKREKARKALEAAYAQAVKDYTRAKNDAEAAATERALLDCRKDGWKHVDLAKVKLKDDYLSLPPQSELPTVRQYAGGFEVVLVARTEAENIRLWAQRGSAVIFNWELNPRELRVTRPDGGEARESGSLATAKVTPLKPNTWYTLKWRVTEDGMQISVDGKVVFVEQKRYELTAPAPVVVHSEKSAVDVKEFRVIPIEKKR